ncbi:MAG: class I SAM-dependent methyltransferase [Planctomycetes bacterium]|nr:class I SAM-dependent methyltransferase [Planctomycetota bacterium]
MTPEERFQFGDNWKAFLTTLDDERIRGAQNSLKELLEVNSLNGKTFLDVGSGSGLMSLAAMRLGAAVLSFDYDPQCVACTEELKRRYYPGGESWKIEPGSALDEDYLNGLGQFDLVYAWGVLHHTGDLFRGIELTSHLVKKGGIYFIAIYNDQGGASRRWLRIKQGYHRLPRFMRPLLVFLIASFFESRYAFARLLRGQNPLPIRDWKQKKMERGMSAWHDWVDWCGGLPFEVAKLEQVVVPLFKKGFALQNLKTAGGGWGCNQYVFQKIT